MNEKEIINRLRNLPNKKLSLEEKGFIFNNIKSEDKKSLTLLVIWKRRLLPSITFILIMFIITVELIHYQDRGKQIARQDFNHLSKTIDGNQKSTVIKDISPESIFPIDPIKESKNKVLHDADSIWRNGSWKHEEASGARYIASFSSTGTNKSMIKIYNTGYPGQDYVTYFSPRKLENLMITEITDGGYNIHFSSSSGVIGTINLKSKSWTFSNDKSLPNRDLVSIKTIFKQTIENGKARLAIYFLLKNNDVKSIFPQMKYLGDGASYLLIGRGQFYPPTPLPFQSNKETDINQKTNSIIIAVNSNKSAVTNVLFLNLTENQFESLQAQILKHAPAHVLPFEK